MKNKLNFKPLRRLITKKARAGFTIEAAVVVPICMVILVSAVMVVLYLHDSVILKAAAASIVPEKYLEAEENENVYVQEAKTYFSRRLIVLKNAVSESSAGSGNVTMNNSGEFKIDLGIANTILKDILGIHAVDIGIESLNARENLIKYKVMCDGIEKTGLIGGDD